MSSAVPSVEGTVSRKVLVSTTAQLAAKVLHLLLNVVSTLAIVRHLAPGEYGVYVLVLTVTTIVGLVADFGLPKVAVREISAARTDENDVVGTIIALRLGLALAGIVVTQAVLLVMRQPPGTLAAAAVASLVFLSEAVLAAIVVCFQVRLVQQVEAFVRTGAEVLETASILALVAVNAGVAWLCLPPAVGSALGAVVAYRLARGYGLQARFSRGLVRTLMRESLPIAPALLLAVLYRKLDSLTLAVMRPSREVGLYGSAAQPVEYYFLTTALFINVMFPLLSRAYGQQERARFLDLYRRGGEALLAVTAIVPVVLVFAAGPMVRQVYGPGYARAAVPLVLLSVAMVFLVLAVWQSLALLVGGCQRVTLHYNALALVVAPVLCVGLISRFGLVGAGCAAVGIAVLVTAASAYCVRRHLGIGLEARGLSRVLTAAAVPLVISGTVTWLHASKGMFAPWPLVMILALVTYVAALFVLRVPHALREVLA